MSFNVFQKKSMHCLSTDAWTIRFPHFYLQKNIFQYKENCQYIHKRRNLLCLSADQIDHDIRDNADGNALRNTVH